MANNLAIAASTNWTIPSLINYFTTNNTLELSADTPFILQDYHVIDDERNSWEKDARSLSDADSLANKFINPLLAVIGKKVGIVLEQQGGSWQVNGKWGVLNMSFSVNVVFKAEKADPIVTRVSDLFRFIALSSMTMFEVAPEQKLKIELTEADLARYDCRQTTIKIFKTLISSRSIPGYSYEWVLHGDITQDLQKFRLAGDPKEKSSLLMSCSKGMKFILNEVYEFDSIEAFRNRLRILGEITIPSGRELIINDPRFVQIVKDAPSNEFNVVLRFVLNYLIAPLGKSLNIVQGGDISVSLGGIKFVILAKEKLTFSLKGGGTTRIVDCHDFVLSILKSRTFLRIPADQELDFSCSQDVLQQPLTPSCPSSLIALLNQHTPAGYGWKYSLGGISSTLTTNGITFRLSSPIYLQTGWYTEKNLISLLLKSSAPELSTGLRDGDEEAIIFIIFKALFYQIYNAYVSDEAPPFFKPDTQTKLMEFIKNRPTISAEERVSIDKILQFTPTEFKNLDLKTQPPSISSVIEPVRKLAYEELYGSLLNGAIREIALELQKAENP